MEKNSIYGEFKRRGIEEGDYNRLKEFCIELLEDNKILKNDLNNKIEEHKSIMRMVDKAERQLLKCKQVWINDLI